MSQMIRAETYARYSSAGQNDTWMHGVKARLDCELMAIWDRRCDVAERQKMYKMSTPIIRMYVDENGHQSLKGDLSNPNKRFLCMTGIIMPISEHDTSLTPRLNELKVKYFGSEGVILHRREIISAKGVFEPLADPAVREEFNAEFLDIVKKAKYRVISVVIDKMKLVEKHGIISAQDPYALALEYLMQRYQYWMQSFSSEFGTSFGDIMAEARGGGEDRLTKEAYNYIFNGKGYNKLENASRCFSSSQIKLKPKKSNIAGLQFADLISHPARRYILSQNGLANDLKTSSFEAEIVNILIENKFRRRQANQIEGYGTVLYPK